MNYKSLIRDKNPKKYTGGYKNVVLFAALADFLSLSKPPSPAPQIGDALLISGAHAFEDPKGFLSWDCKTDSVTGTSALVGDAGAQEIEFRYPFTIVGDDEYIQDMLQRMVNDHIIWLLKEANCLEDDKYVQLGDECTAPRYELNGDMKNTAAGMKEQTITIITKAKYFYTGTVTMSTETEE